MNTSHTDGIVVALNNDVCVKREVKKISVAEIISAKVARGAGGVHFRSFSPSNFFTRK